MVGFSFGHCSYAMAQNRLKTGHDWLFCITKQLASITSMNKMIPWGILLMSVIFVAHRWGHNIYVFISSSHCHWVINVDVMREEGEEGDCTWHPHSHLIVIIIDVDEMRVRVRGEDDDDDDVVVALLLSCYGGERGWGWGCIILVSSLHLLVVSLPLTT